MHPEDRKWGSTGPFGKRDQGQTLPRSTGRTVAKKWKATNDIDDRETKRTRIEAPSVVCSSAETVVPVPNDFTWTNDDSFWNNVVSNSDKSQASVDWSFGGWGSASAKSPPPAVDKWGIENDESSRLAAPQIRSSSSSSQTSLSVYKRDDKYQSKLQVPEQVKGKSKSSFQPWSSSTASAASSSAGFTNPMRSKLDENLGKGMPSSITNQHPPTSSLAVLTKSMENLLPMPAPSPVASPSSPYQPPPILSITPKIIEEFSAPTEFQSLASQSISTPDTITARRDFWKPQIRSESK